jgi:hypothetical protein
MSIRLVEAAEYYKGLPHQIDAFNWLQSKITKEDLDLFAKKYRNQEKTPTQTQTFTNTWNGVLSAGKAAGAKFPEVVAAQWALESGWGKATSGTHNYFGLKGNGSNVNTQEFLNGKWITIKAGFIDFPDLYTCVCYLVERWYKDFGQFKGVNRAKDRNECARLLVVEGYATDPDYASKLMQIMDRELVLNKPPAPQPTPAPVSKFNPWSPFSYKITPHISYGELTLNQEGRRFNKQYQCDAALELCGFIEKARAYFGNKPVIITSAHRPPKINASVGGATNSEHLYSAPNVGAVDFYIEGVNIWTLQEWCDKNWPYSLGYGAPKGFVHIGMRAGKPKVRWDY